MPPSKPKPRKRPRGSFKPAWQKELVLERIRILFEQAEKSFRGHSERSKRYVEMALKLSTRYNVRLSPDIKRRFCKSCKSLLVPGVNSRVRTSPSQGAVIITCKECGHVARHPYRREKSGKQHVK
jgi:ribonuclease P protein subunit RPR2